MDDLTEGTFLTALDDVTASMEAAFLDALDDTGPDAAPAEEEPEEQPFDLDASLKEEAALAAWIRRATARRNQLTAINRRALVTIERKTSGRTWTPSFNGVQIGTVTLKGNAHDVVVTDENAFTRWVAATFPTEVTSVLDMGEVTDPEALVEWLISHGAPCHPTVRREVRGSFRSSVLGDLSKAATTTLTKVADKTTGEVVEYHVRGVEVREVPPETRVHQITFNKHGGQDAAADYFADRGLAALIPGEDG